MSHYPTSTVGNNYITYPAGPAVVGTTLTANASNNTKGSYAEIVASTSFATTHVHVKVLNGAAAAREYLFDIATGAAASETVVLPNMLAESYSSLSTNYAHRVYNDVPLVIGNATRISGRCQCSTGSAAMTVAITAITTSGTFGQSSFTNIGSDTSTSTGVNLDPGGSANTKGSYVELTASTAADYSWLLVMLVRGSSTYATCAWAADLATGAGGAEVVLIPDMRASLASDSGTRGSMAPTGYPFLTFIASGTRVSGRSSCNITTATSRIITMALLAISAPTETAGGTVRLSNAAANAAVDAITALLNGGKLDIYDGSQPADGNTAVSGQTLLASLTFANPAFASASAGVATANSITTDSDADATGTATWFRLKKSDDSTVLDGATGSDLVLDSNSITQHGSVAVGSFTLTLPEHA